MNAYSVQFTTLARAVTMLAMGLVCTFKWRSFTRDQDIAEIESRASIEQVHRRQQKKALGGAAAALRMRILKK